MIIFFKAFLYLQFGFVFFWENNIGFEAAHKMLMKLTTEWNVDYYVTESRGRPNRVTNPDLKSKPVYPNLSSRQILPTRHHHFFYRINEKKLDSFSKQSILCTSTSLGPQNSGNC
jgi:hypothetical protein